MIEYSTYRPTDGLEAVEVWNRAFGDPFPMDLRLWRQNVDKSPTTNFEASIVARDSDTESVVGFLIAKSPQNINSIAVDPERQRSGIGYRMFELARERSGLSAETMWTAGQDRGHFFPGVPQECPSGVQFFEKRLQFTRGSGITVDLVRDLTGFEIEPRIRERIEALERDGITLGPCEAADRAALADHIASNFSERWLADTISRVEAEPTAREIIIAKRPATGEVVGFAQTFSNRSQYIGPSIYWRPLLGPKYGGLGPIGVDKDLRKIGLGLALLAFSVQDVKNRGAMKMAIDWTNLVEFYAKVGFTPWKHYVSMRQA